jgi:ubiquinone/menaquinone biosynthesis C-methylase UbiE
MANPPRESNLDVWNKPEVTSYYSSLNYLTPCERLLFDEYLKVGMSILDLGVGGGRTTPYLSSIAGRYVGADYAAAMTVTCQKKFPHLEFHTADAADLSRFAMSSFDAVVMAYNGIDNLIPDESRRGAWREIHRVLKPKGVLVFSSHNMRSILVRPSWNPQRLASFAKRMVRENSVWYRPLLWALTSVRIAIAVVQAMGRSAARMMQRIPTRAFWRGEGYLMDSAHGGTRIHYATPERVVKEVHQCGLRVERVLGDDYPRASHVYVTDWYYFVFIRDGAAPLGVIPDTPLE